MDNSAGLIRTIGPTGMWDMRSHHPIIPSSHICFPSRAGVAHRTGDASSQSCTNMIHCRWHHNNTRTSPLEPQASDLEMRRLVTATDDRHQGRWCSPRRSLQLQQLGWWTYLDVLQYLEKHQAWDKYIGKRGKTFDMSGRCRSLRSLIVGRFSSGNQYIVTGMTNWRFWYDTKTKCELAGLPWLVLMDEPAWLRACLLWYVQSSAGNGAPLDTTLSVSWW